MTALKKSTKTTQVRKCFHPNSDIYSHLNKKKIKFKKNYEKKKSLNGTYRSKIAQKQHMLNIKWMLLIAIVHSSAVCLFVFYFNSFKFEIKNQIATGRAAKALKEREVKFLMNNENWH